MEQDDRIPPKMVIVDGALDELSAKERDEFMDMLPDILKRIMAAEDFREAEEKKKLN